MDRPSTSPPAVVVTRSGELHVWIRDEDLKLWHREFIPAEGGWQPWEPWADNVVNDPVAYTWGEQEVGVIAQGAGDTLLHVYQQGANLQRETLLNGIH
jgi:hypothetical protein